MVFLAPPKKHSSTHLIMKDWNMMFLFNWVFLRFQPLIFQGVSKYSFQEVEVLKFTLCDPTWAYQ